MDQGQPRLPDGRRLLWKRARGLSCSPKWLMLSKRGLATHTHPFNAHTLHAVPVAPATDHHPELPLPPSDRDHWPHGTTDLCRSEKGLIPQGRLDLADIRRLHLSLLSRLAVARRAPITPSPQRSAGEEPRRVP